MIILVHIGLSILINISNMYFGLRKENNQMKIKDSNVWKELISKNNTFVTTDGSPALPADTAEVYAQQIHDLLVGKNFTYMNCWIILFLVQNTLRQERDLKKL